MDAQSANEPTSTPGGEAGLIWPSAEYAGFVERLRKAVGRRIYLAEVQIGAVQMSANLSDRSYELLGVVDFPRPDPAKRNYPHLILLDDGRGVNLGRVARISLNTPFAPPPEDILFCEQLFLDQLLFAPQRFSRAQIAGNSKRILGELLGKSAEEVTRLPGRE